MMRSLLRLLASTAIAAAGPDEDGADNYAFKIIARRSQPGNCSLYLSPNRTTSCWTTPLYSDLNGSIWDNPTLDEYSETWTELNPQQDFVDADPTDVNGLCDPTSAFDLDKCCRPAPGCLPMRGFNWILSTCVGTTCGDWGQAETFGAWQAGTLPLCSEAGNLSPGCVSDEDPNVVCKTSDIGVIFGCQNQTIVEKTIEARDAGSAVEVNYVAAYSFMNGTWIKDTESSFNSYGLHEPQDLSDVTLDPSKRWMPGPMPGGAVFWNNGYYPGGVAGVGASDKGATGMMYVLSTNKLKNMAFYIMNQATLDRGPAISYGGANTWACANSGEFDILESSWSMLGTDEDGSYDNLFATMSNQGPCGGALSETTLP